MVGPLLPRQEAVRALLGHISENQLIRRPTRLPAALVAALGFRYPFTALAPIVLLEYDPANRKHHPTVMLTRENMKLEGGE